MQASYDQYMPYLFSRAGAAGVPLAGTFELTCRCNFDCRMCYIHRSQFDASARAAERDAAWWLALARSARDAGMLTLLLTGGEPLLRPDFPEIYTACRNLGLLVSVNTNGTLLTPELVQLLAQTPPQRINLTLYGASRETYAALCGRPEAYDRVLWTIDALQAAGVPLKLNFTETPYNQADAPAVYAFARARGLRVDAVTYCFPPVRARENGACTSERFSPEVSAREQVRYDRFRFGEEGFRARARALLDGQTLPPADACQELPTEKIRCRAGLSTFWVTWDGQLRPCGMMCTYRSGTISRLRGRRSAPRASGSCCRPNAQPVRTGRRATSARRWPMPNTRISPPCRSISARARRNIWLSAKKPLPIRL